MTVALRIAAGGCGHSCFLSLDVCEAEQALGPAAPLNDGRAARQRQAGMKTRRGKQGHRGALHLRTPLRWHPSTDAIQAEIAGLYGSRLAQGVTSR